MLVGAVMWPVVLSAALGARVARAPEAAGLWPVIVYAAASRVCHQDEARSFHTGDVQWPVCARCAGLYAAAPFGAFLVGRLRRASRQQMIRFLAVAAAPTIATVAWEWLGGPMPPHLVRFATALPLGAAVLAALIAVTHQVD